MNTALKKAGIRILKFLLYNTFAKKLNLLSFKDLNKKI